MTPLAEWANYYVIVGSSAAALTGLQFVVMALIADSGRQGTGHEIAAFGTPTIVHFGAALLVSAIVSAPWHALGAPAWVFGVVSIAGLLYAGVTIQRARRQRGYRPVFEDWLWHAALPLATYATLLVGAVTLRPQPRGALFAVAAAVMLLLTIGIHNAWDTVTFIVLARFGPRATEPAGSGATAGGAGAESTPGAQRGAMNVPDSSSS